MPDINFYRPLISLKQWLPLLYITLGILLLIALGIIFPVSRHATKYFLDHWLDHLVGVVALAAGLYAILLAFNTEKIIVVQVNKLVEVGDKLSDVSVKLGELEKWIPTRFVGAFPGHITAITSLVHSLQRGDTFCVMCDVADYGSFFAPELHAELHKALREAMLNRNAHLDYLVLERGKPFTQNSSLAKCADQVMTGNMGADCKSALIPYLDKWITFIERDEEVQDLFISWDAIDPEYLDTQFFQPRRLIKERILSLEEFCSLMRGLVEKNPRMRSDNYNELHRSILGDGIDGWKKFSTIMLFREQVLESQLSTGQRSYKRIPEDKLPEKPPVFLWMRISGSHKEAVFLFNNVDLPLNRERGLAFKTTDPGFTGELYDIFNLYKEASVQNRSR